MKKFLQNKSLLTVLMIQTILIVWNFLPFFTNGEDFIFCLAGDGLKNYYTIYSYLLQAKGEYSMFHSMNYPFSEYIFFTDNSPSFAVPLKWISDNFIDLSPYAFRLYNWFIILGFLLSTLFTWLIINKLTKQIWLWSALAITLPWISPQVNRLVMGHFNLSFTWVILLTFYLLILVYENRNELKKVLSLSFLLLISTYLISFIHLYYLPMILVMIGMFGLVISIWERKNRKRLLAWLSFTFGFPILNLAAIWLTIRGFDAFYLLRKSTDPKYTWWEWNLKIDALYTDFYEATIPFFVQANFQIDWEGYAYLGAFGLYAFVFLFGYLLMKTIKQPKQFRPTFRTYFSNQTGRKVLLILFSGLMCLNIALGEYVKMFNGTVNFDNPLHPFLYAKLFIDEITQFRVLARFNWVFFWSFQLVMIYVLSLFLERKKSIWIKVLVGVLIVFSVLDMGNMQQHIKQNISLNPLANQVLNLEFDALIEGIETEKYQAILPVPIYMIGSEDDEMMLMPNDEWRTKTWLLSTKMDLPLMATNLSRSAIVQHESLLSIFTEKGMNTYLKKAINEKPILVFYTENPAAWNMKYENEQAQKYLDFGKLLPEKYDMKLIKTQGELKIYEWFPELIKSK